MTPSFRKPCPRCGNWPGNHPAIFDKLHTNKIDFVRERLNRLDLILSVTTSTTKRFSSCKIPEWPRRCSCRAIYGSEY